MPYHQKSYGGRHWQDNSIGVQGIFKYIRHTTMGRNVWVDIDMKNAHCEIALYFAKNGVLLMMLWKNIHLIEMK